MLSGRRTELRTVQRLAGCPEAPIAGQPGLTGWERPSGDPGRRSRGRKKHLFFASHHARKDLPNASTRESHDEAASEEIGLPGALRAGGVRRSMVAASHSRSHVQGPKAV